MKYVRFIWHFYFKRRLMTMEYRFFNYALDVVAGAKLKPTRSCDKDDWRC